MADKKKRREEEEKLAKAQYAKGNVRVKDEQGQKVVRNYGIKPLYQRIDERKQQARMLGRDMRSEQNAFMRDAMTGGIQMARENQQKRQTQRDMDMAIELIRTGKMDLPAMDQMPETVKPGYGYKRAGNQAVYATPNSPLPDPKKAKTANRAQAPGAFGISPEQYKEGMQAIREQEAFGKRERPAATKDTMANEGARNFLDKWFPEKGNELPTQDEMLKKWAQVEPYQQDLYWMDYQNVSGAIDEHRLSAEEGAAAYDEEKIRRQAAFDDAIRLLGEDATQYANETEADQMGRFAHTYGMGDAAKKYAQEYKVPGLFENYDAHDAEMYMIMHPEQKEKLSQYAGTENETGYSILHREMTQDQKDIYMALAAVHGEEAAQDWLRSLLRDKGYNERAYWTRDEALREYANEHPVLATGKSFLNVPLQISGVGYAVGQALKGEKIDPFDFAFAPTQAVQTPRDEVSQMITRNYGTVGEDGQMKDNLLSWLMKAGYSAATSGGDSVMAAGLGMGIPGAGAAIQGVLGASGQIQDASMRGADTADALLKGGVSAVIETATEYLPMEHFIKTMDSGDIRTVKDVLVNALKGGLTEAPGEGASELLGYISDDLIMGEMSNWDALVAEKGVEGAAAQVAWDVFNGAFVGFLSGTGTSTMAGTKAAVQNALTENPETATPDVQKPAPEAPAVEQTEEQEPAQQEQQDYWEPEAEPDVDKGVLRQEREVTGRRHEAEQTIEEEQQDYWEPEAEPDVDKSVLRQEREVTGRRPKEEQAAEDTAETPAEEAEQPVQEQQDEEQQAEEKEPAKEPENAKAGNPLRQERAVTVRRNKNEQQMTVTGVEDVSNGSVFLNVRNADGEIEVAAAGDVEFEDPAINELLATKQAASFDGKTASIFLEGYNAKLASPQEYAQAFASAYEDGRAGLEYERMLQVDRMASTYLTSDARLKAYAAGMNAYNQKSAETGKTGGVQRKYSADVWRMLSGAKKQRARANLEMADVLGKRMGKTIEVVDEIVVDGVNANAMYDRRTGTIKVALTADAQAYAYVAMHELTHALKNEHANEWSEFENFVAGALERSGQDLADLVSEQMERYGLSAEEAMEEAICNTVPALLMDERNLLELYKGNRTLFERVMDWVRNLLDDIKASGDILAKGSRDWKQMDALKQNREDMQTILQMMENIMSGSKAEEQTITTLDEAQLEQVVVKGEVPNVMETPVDANGAEVKYSRSTYEQSMAKDMNERKAKSLGIPYEVRTVGANQKKAVYATGRDVTEAVMKKENISQKVIDKALGYVDKVSKWFESAVGKYEFVNLQDVNDASIMIDHNTGKIVFSCMVPNAEYKVNFDFTTVCRQREAVQRFVDDLAKTPGKNGETKLDEISLTPENIFKLNTILKDEGYETACLGCFVEAKRYRIKDQADTLVKEWNDLVLAKNPNAEYFDFATGETDLFKMSTEEISKLEANMRNYNTKGTSRATERAERLVEVPEMQKLLRPGDFISRQGRKAIREFSPALESFLVSRFGQGGAKPAVGFMPYNSEVALLPDTKSVKGKRMTLQQYLAGMGGARSNSFSDFLASHAMDYLQRTVDLAARNLTAQCYTKVPGRALLFGRMGEKVNMSVMFDIDPKLHWSMAGLDANGEYIVGDKARAQRVQEETGVRPFTQSFPWEQAVAIEHDERYAENCGIIGVGYSYNHMAKMMEDDNVPYIIGYHRSNLPENVAKASNTSHATNYEPVQNTTRLNGYAKVRNMDEANGVPSYATWPEGKKKTVKSDMTWDMQAAMKRNGGNATKTLTEWLAWMKENDLTPMTSAGEAGHGAFDLYGSLEKTMDPARTAEEYASYCLKKGMLPVFYEFMDIDGYDKVLFDFSVRNLATGEVAPQRPVSLDFLDDMTAEEFTSILENEMGEHNEYNRKQFGSEKWERVKSQAHEQLKFSRKGLDDEYAKAVRKGDKETQRKLLDEAAMAAGYQGGYYHGTQSFGFTTFDLSKMDDGRSIFVTDDLDIAKTYSGERGKRKIIEKDFLGIGNYELYVRPGEVLEIDAKGANWDNIMRPMELVTHKEKVISFLDEIEDVNEWIDILNEHGFHVGMGMSWDGSEYFYNTNTGEPVELEQIEDAIMMRGDDEREYLTTRELAEEAQKNGYDSVYIKNVRDLGPMFDMLEGDKPKTANIRILFDPNDVKSADLVTYDDKGKMIPLSQRFSEESQDIRYSRKGLDANIDEELEHARDAFELVRHSHRITAAEADQLAGKILKEAQSTYDRTTLAGEIAEIMDYIERADTVNMDHVDEMETSLMARVMEQSRVLDEEHEQLVDPIRQYFKGTHIMLTDTQIKEAANLAGSYAAYRRQVMGRVKLSKNAGTELDVAWEELNEINPEWFPLDAAEGDMPEMLLQVVDAIKPAYNTVTNLEETASWLAGKLNEAYFALPAVKAGAKSQTKLGVSLKEMRQAMTRFAEASGETFGEALKQLEKTRKKNKDTSDKEAWIELRRQWDEWKAKDADEREERFQMDLQRAKEKLKANDLAMRAVYAKVMAEAYKRQRAKDMAETREREALKKQRARTEATARTLMNWLEKPTDAKHVPAGLDEPLKNALLVLDFGGKDTKVAKGLSERLEQLATAVEQAQERENDERTMFLERDQQMVDELRRVAQLIKGNTEGRGVYDLNSMELKELNKWLGAIRHTILQASKMHGTNLGDVQQVAAESIQEIARKKPMKDKKWITKQWENLFGPDMMDSFTFFERLGPTSTRVFNELRKGFDKTTQLIRDAEKRTKEMLKDVDLKKLSGKKAEKLKVDVRGRTVEMTRANIMELYVLNKRDQARGHIYKGGFRIKGDEDAHPLLVKEEDVAKITDLLTDEEKRIADAMQEYLSKECAAWGNETSMKLLGYEKFGEESYWPIMTDSNERNTTKLEENFAANIAAIKNQGMTKQLIEGASNAIIIGDIFDTYTQHISNMSAYAGYAVPLSDMQRWINSRGVKTEIEHVMGAKGKQYINNFLMAVNGTAARTPMTGVEKLAKTAARNAKTAAVGGNIRVIVQQPTSYARAAMYMSPKYLTEALAAKKPDAELVNKYCSIAAWKRYGFYETNVGPGMREMIVGDTGAVNKLRDIMMEPAAAGDNWTLNHLWAACELETADVYPELEKGSDEYYQKVGERMSEIIDRTQVVDSPFHRSQIMRSKSWMAQTLTNFMSEPTKTFNMLTSAIYAYADNRKNPAARARVARALGVWAATSVLTAAAAGIVDAFRDDDEEKKWLEKYGDAVLGNTVDSMNPLGMLPGVKDVLSIIQGYDPSRIEQQSIQKIVWAAEEIEKYLNGTSKMNLYGVTYKVAQALSSVTGVPVSNVMRDVNAAIQSVAGINLTLSDKARKNQTIDGLYDTMTEAGKAKTTKEKDAAKKKIDEARAKLTKIGMNPKEIDTALAERLAEDPRIKAAWEAKQAHKVGDVNRTKNALAHDGFTGEMVDKAIAEYGKTVTPKEEKGKDMNAQLKAKLFTQDEAVAAIRAGASNEDIEYMMSELVSDSSAKDPEKSVRDGLKAEVKKDYLEAVRKGDRSKADRSRDILTSVLKVPEADLTKWEQEQHADDLRLAIDAYNSVNAAKAVAVMRADGKNDSDIKGSLGKYRQMYIDAVRNKDSRTANKIKSLLLGLGLMGKNGKPLYTEETFADWVK